MLTDLNYTDKDKKKLLIYIDNWHYRFYKLCRLITWAYHTSDCARFYIR